LIYASIYQTKQKFDSPVFGLLLLHLPKI